MIRHILKINRKKNFCAALAMFVAFSFGVVSVVDAARELSEVPIDESKVIEINNSLKNIIEENEKLMGQNKKLEGEVKRLSSVQSSGQGDYEQLKMERDSLHGKLSSVKDKNNMYSKEVKKLEENVKQLELAKVEYDRKTKRLEEELVMQEKMYRQEEILQLASVVDTDVAKNESKTLDLLSKIDAFQEKDDNLRNDAAKAHYNMGNIYFQKGEYEISAREYYQAITLMPNDPDSHYNLAYVSSEKLKDYRTALKHYRMYLYLNPNAKDQHVVKEKIMQAKIAIRGEIDSPLEECLAEDTKC